MPWEAVKPVLPAGPLSQLAPGYHLLPEAIEFALSHPPEKCMPFARCKPEKRTC